MPLPKLESLPDAALLVHVEVTGAVQIGADADITVFDPARIIDRATYQNPYQAPEGILYVIVAGEPVVFQGQLIEDAYPGKRLTAQRAPD